MVDWTYCAKIAEEVYGMQVDWEERFFICPECQEPIYECDYPYFKGDDEGFECPVCEEVM